MKRMWDKNELNEKIKSKYIFLGELAKSPDNSFDITKMINDEGVYLIVIPDHYENETSYTFNVYVEKINTGVVYNHFDTPIFMAYVADSDKPIYGRCYYGVLNFYDLQGKVVNLTCDSDKISIYKLA